MPYLEHGAAAVSLDHHDVVAHHVADREQRDGRAGHDQVHAIELERTTEAPPDNVEHAALSQLRIIDERNRQAGDEDESLRRVGEAVIARSQVLEDVAWNMVHENNDEHESSPKIDHGVAASRGVHSNPRSFSDDGRTPENGSGSENRHQLFETDSALEPGISDRPS